LILLAEHEEADEEGTMVRAMNETMKPQKRNDTKKFFLHVFLRPTNSTQPQLFYRFVRCRNEEGSNSGGQSDSHNATCCFAMRSVAFLFLAGLHFLLWWLPVLDCKENGKKQIQIRDSVIVTNHGISGSETDSRFA